ncbi:hypothetical protein [Microbacterium sp.]|uniref:hypothetical protein n=1 Tax=Microbacterium sp. TaxID=51671 RepID=UPI0039E6F3D0
MLTPREAEQRLRDYFREDPPPLRGTLYFPGGWAEDDEDYLLEWGAREFIVDGRESFGRWDNLVYFVNKHTGEVSKGHFNANFGKIDKMVEHFSPEERYR